MTRSPPSGDFPALNYAAIWRSPSPPAWESAAREIASASPSSMSFAEIATGWHALKVEGYSQINGQLGVARRMKSCPFVVGGHTWCITYFPDGLTADAADCISLALRLESRRRRAGGAARRVAPALAGGGRESVMVRAKFSLLDAAGAPSFTAPGDDVVWTFSSIDQSCSHARFMKRKEFESTYLKDDEFTVRCDVMTVVQEDRRLPPPDDLHRQLGELLSSGDGADVTIDVGGEAFRAHRSVLAARSPVFKAVFFGGPHREHGASRVSVHDIEPSVFRALLRYIYTDMLPPDIDGGDRTAMVQHLLVAADRFGIDRLKSICEHVLSSPVDTSAVVTTLVLAEQHGCHQLKEACFKVLRLLSPDNYEELVFGQDLQYLASTCPSLVQELRVLQN